VIRAALVNFQLTVDSIPGMVHTMKPNGEVEFVITVKEFAVRNRLHMQFYAQADKEVNQKTAAFLPFGWGDTLLKALAECMRTIREHPYEPE